MMTDKFTLIVVSALLLLIRIWAYTKRVNNVKLDFSFSIDLYLIAYNVTAINRLGPSLDEQPS